MDISSRVIVIDKGRIIFDGDSEEALKKYYSIVNQAKYRSLGREVQRASANLNDMSSSEVEVINLGIMDDNGNRIDCISGGEDINAFADLIVSKRIAKPRFAVAIRDDRGINLIWHVNLDRQVVCNPLDPGKYRLKVRFANPPLEASVYRIVFGLRDAETLEYYEKITSKGENVFEVKSNRIPRGTISVDSEWEIVEID